VNPVPGESKFDQAIRVSGAFAEFSLAELTWQEHHATEVRLLTRTTDLPGLLSKAANGSRLIAKSIQITIQVQASGLEWSSPSPEHAAAFSAALNQA
jgi:hypothetical protein